MGELERPVLQARRRLRFQRFLDALCWSLAVGLVVAAVVLALSKAGIFVPAIRGPWLVLAVGAGVAFVTAAVVAFLTGPSPMQAAVAIDHAFDLKERLSSAMSLPDYLKGSQAAQAMLEDAKRHAVLLDVGSKFGLKVPRRSWLAVLGAVLAAVAVLLPADWVKRTARATSTAAETNLDQAEAKKRAEKLSRSMAQARKELERGELDETSKLLAEIEKFADEMVKNPPATKEQAMVEMNKLTQALEDRQKQLGSTDQMQRQLQQMKQMANGGPADEFSKELSQGDFSKAAEQVKDLKEKLQSGKLSEAEKQDLMKQLGDMSKQLQKMANLDERKKMLEEARKNGGLTEQQFQDEMAKLNAQAQDMKQLQQLAEQLSKAQQAMQQGDMSKAANELGMSQEQLQQLAEQVGELETLDSALAEMLESKAGLSGDSMNQLGEAMGDMGNMMGNRMGNNNGNGGQGQGAGDRSEAPDDVNSYNTRSPQQYTKGAAVVTGFAPPRDVTPGQSIVEIQGELSTGDAGIAEAMSNQKVPANVKKHVLGYFDQIRKGE